MTDELHNKKCIPCEGGIPAFKIDEINEYLKKVDGWSVKEDEKDKFYLIKEFKLFISFTIKAPIPFGPPILCEDIDEN